MKEFFINGGWGMFPTLALGCFLLGAVVRANVNPRSNASEIVLPLGVATITAGFLGFVLGLMATFRHIGEVGGNGTIAMVGAGESLSNLALAFGLVLAAAILFAVGRGVRPVYSTRSDEPNAR
jgi:hypothetical protein